MTDRPILFSGPMVRAILAGRKTQTRRVAPDGGLHSHRFRLGDRLWVRERFIPDAPDGEGWRDARLSFVEWNGCGRRVDDIPQCYRRPENVIYAADPDYAAHQDWKWRPSIHMPRWASRLTLTVVALRGQRLQDINETDAEAEGITKHGRFWGVADADWDSASTESAVQAYANLWDDLNAARGYGWDSNPWVVAITFDVEQRNIDQ